jgi:hypothetical protein
MNSPETRQHCSCARSIYTTSTEISFPQDLITHWSTTHIQKSCVWHSLGEEKQQKIAQQYICFPQEGRNDSHRQPSLRVQMMKMSEREWWPGQSLSVGGVWTCSSSLPHPVNLITHSAPNDSNSFSLSSGGPVGSLCYMGDVYMLWGKRVPKY